jgi:hypothetical protein
MSLHNPSRFSNGEHQGALAFPQSLVTSNLVSQIKTGNHGRGRDGLLHSESARSKPFVSRILVSKLFEKRILRGISC